MRILRVGLWARGRGKVRRLWGKESGSTGGEVGRVRLEWGLQTARGYCGVCRVRRPQRCKAEQGSTLLMYICVWIRSRCCDAHSWAVLHSAYTRWPWAVRVDVTLKQCVNAARDARPVTGRGTTRGPWKPACCQTETLTPRRSQPRENGIVCKPLVFGLCKPYPSHLAGS